MDNQLKQRIDQYPDFPWEKLQRKDLGKYSLEDLNENFEKIKSYFDSVIEFPNLRKLPEKYLQVLLTQLNELFEFENQLSTQFQNVSERQEWINKVKQFEHQVWTALWPVIGYIKFTLSNGDVSSKQFEEKVKQLDQLGSTLTQKLQNVSDFENRVEKVLGEVSQRGDEVKKVAEQVAKDKEKYSKASEIAENWIKTEGKATAGTLQDKSKIFNDKADLEHTGKRVTLWLLGVLVFASGAVASAGLLIWKLNGSGEGLSVGAALLRISVVGMFFSLAYLCYQQFSIQRRLYEVYKFKAIALSTMENLIKSFTEPQDRQIIVEKAIDIVFTEPSFKEDKVAHQRVIDELIDVIKKKV